MTNIYKLKKKKCATQGSITTISKSLSVIFIVAKLLSSHISLAFRSIRSYSINFNLIRSTLVLFGKFCPLQSCFVHFCSIQSNLVHSALFSPFGLLWFYYVHSFLFGLILSTWVIFGPFHLI